MLQAEMLGHAGTEIAIGSKLGIDATEKLPGDHPRGVLTLALSPLTPLRGEGRG